MRVSQVMTRHPITVSSTATLAEALSEMAQRDIHALPVVDNDELVGIITDRDLKMMLGPAARDLDLDAADQSVLQYEVSKVMTVEVESVNPNTPLSAACRLLAELRVGALPVVDPDGGQLVGIISVTDLLAVAATVFERDE